MLFAMKINFQLHHWPVLLAGWVSMSLVVSYIVAVASDNVHPLFPYISELGAWKPSSSVFGQLANIAAIISAITMYIRYHQVNAAINLSQCDLNKKWNEVALWLGFVMSVGLTLVANFQGDFEGNYVILGVHLIGAGMSFALGGIYMSIQTRITFALRPYYKKYTQFGVSVFIQYFRLFSTIFLFVNLVSLLAFALAVPSESNGYRLQGIVPGDDGYTFHIMSVISEWMLALILISMLLTVKNEFKVISFQGIIFKTVIES